MKKEQEKKMQQEIKAVDEVSVKTLVVAGVRGRGWDGWGWQQPGKWQLCCSKPCGEERGDGDGFQKEKAAGVWQSKLKRITEILVAHMSLVIINLFCQLVPPSCIAAASSAGAGYCCLSSSSAFVRRDGAEEFRLVFCQNLTLRSSL